MSKQDLIYIYQLNNEDVNRKRRWLDYNSLIEYGLKPDYEGYDMVFRDEVISGLFRKETLDDVYMLYNGINRPRKFKARSLSVSDVVVIEKPDAVEAYYVDTVGFVELPEFAKEHMFHLSPLRNERIYELQGADVFNVILDLDIADELTMDEIKDIVDNAKTKLSLEWYDAVQALVENYIAERDYKKQRKPQNDR